MNNLKKHEYVRKDIENTIETTMSPGDKLPTETEYQKKYKVSRQTIRTALKNLENRGIIYKEQGVGSFVRKLPSNKRKRTKTIGVITTYLSDYIFPNIIRGIESELSQSGYNLLLGSTNNDMDREKEVLDNMINQDIDGLIIEPTKSSLLNKNIGTYLKLKEKRFPMVMMHSVYEEVDIPYVSLNDRLAGYTATKHLIENGHTKIGGIFKNDDRQGRERLKGFIDACYEFGIDYNSEDMIFYDTESYNSDLDVRINDAICYKQKITALVCYNDQIAIMVLKIMKKLNIKVPDDISIVSHDNSILTELSDIKITSINHPKDRLGEKTAQMLVEMIETGSNDIDSYQFEGELIIRNSVTKQ